MSVYYFDASVVVKRYVNESGTARIRWLCFARDEETNARLHRIIVGEISRVEVASAITRKATKTKEISEQNAEASYKLFIAHLEDEYQVALVSSVLLRFAADLARKYSLRAYDAVQLAHAVQANNFLIENDLSLIFISSDKTLMQAAQAEGLPTENPDDHEPNSPR